jgi:hypothetical protein
MHDVGPHVFVCWLTAVIERFATATRECVSCGNKIACDWVRPEHSGWSPVQAIDCSRAEHSTRLRAVRQ